MSISTFRHSGKKIVAIGRNFGAHAKELGNAVPTSPFFFLKPTTSYLDDGGTVLIPKGVEAHFEVELGVVVGKEARDVKRADAERHIGGYALGIDMTARNLQDKAKKAGLPWSAAKGFDTFNPVSSLIEKSKIADPHNVRLWLAVNEAMKQNGNTQDMIFDIPHLLEYISSIMTLEVGDLVLTGTPQGVGRVVAGDVITAGLGLPDSKEDLAKLKINVADRQGLFQVD
ncbi:hypothetical protein IE81DRAFT_259205 [Ceraceosorus guamensis]|uniref:Fumarylacetoacetase-like C-terminal domain-containing protein n=1 Tax=Ceraceosorus guamensis TaxID=1522189 RepID=A0A316VQ50_9BASI|nr:hypothetical protein IE81DRAFT_259205 [Ceraceosorus guamensis]PWN39717.1 hypothetical protein IE81DRAFT_259205 [Ceraceosorus guamensis]